MSTMLETKKGWLIVLSLSGLFKGTIDSHLHI